jgi:hypothetical protein
MKVSILWNLTYQPPLFLSNHIFGVDRFFQAVMILPVDPFP